MSMPVSTWGWGAIADTKRVGAPRLAPRQGYQSRADGLPLARFGRGAETPSRERASGLELVHRDLPGEPERGQLGAQLGGSPGEQRERAVVPGHDVRDAEQPARMGGLEGIHRVVPADRQDR